MYPRAPVLRISLFKRVALTSFRGPIDQRHRHWVVRTVQHDGFEGLGIWRWIVVCGRNLGTGVCDDKS